MTKKTKTKSKGIVSWPSAERPRERLLHSGPEALSDGELLAIPGMGIAKTAQLKAAIEIGKSLNVIFRLDPSTHRNK